VALLGDFNSTCWHPPFRTLLDEGLSSAHLHVGRRLSMSWPTRWLGLMRLDHVLYNDALVATNLRDFTIPGSDHRGVVVDLSLRPSRWSVAP
jgi:endonuclease/exonuclease/phosphatase (EEP) superfamily protein YafD